jgi:hypothetical protein
MDQFIRHTIKDLKKSTDKAEVAQGVILEILLSQNNKLESIEEQTKRTNGRVTKLEDQVAPLVEHDKKRRWLQSVAIALAGVVGTIGGAVAAFFKS